MSEMKPKWPGLETFWEWVQWFVVSGIRGPLLDWTIIVQRANMQATIWKHRTQRGEARLCIRFKGNHPGDKPSRECMALVRPCGSYRKGGKQGEPACWYINDPDQLMASLNNNSSQDPDILSLVQAMHGLGQQAAPQQLVATVVPVQVAPEQVAPEQGPTQGGDDDGVGGGSPQAIAGVTYTTPSGKTFSDLRQLITERRQNRLRCCACEEEARMENQGDPSFQSGMLHNTISDQCWFHC